MEMKRAHLEKNIALVLFVLVLIVFSFAQKASQKLDPMYAVKMSQGRLQKEKQLVIASSTAHPVAVKVTAQ